MTTMIRIGLSLGLLLAVSTAHAQHKGARTPAPLPEVAPPPPPPAPVVQAPIQQTPPAPVEEVPAQQVRGLVFEARLGSAFGAISAGGELVAAIPGFMGGIFAGYKIDRLTIGLSLEVASLSTGQDKSMTAGGMTANTSRSNASTLFLFEPGLRIALVRSADQRVELIGVLDLGLGKNFTSSSVTPAPMPMMGVTTTSDNSGFHLAYTVAPGVRYWVHPQFAVGAIAGLRGDYDTETQKDTVTVGGQVSSTSTTNSSLINAFMAQLQFTGVF